jgi:hypothetical protein
MAYDPFSTISLQRADRVLRRPVTGRTLPAQQTAAAGSGTGRFGELLGGSALSRNGQKLLDDVLGLGKGDGKEESPLEGAMLGSMNLLNTRALATLTRVLSGPSGPSGLAGLASGGAPAGTAALPVEGLASLRSAIADAVGLGSETGEVRGRISWNGAAAAYRQAAEAPDGMSALRQEPAAPESAGQIAPADGKNAVGGVAESAPLTGWLAAQFESGTQGVASIGYDRHGGTSYGKYQISSRAGSMDAFIRFLQRAAPEYAQRLNAAGPANTGGTQGAMPRVWAQIAAADPAGFESLQNRFVRENNFLPALRKVTRNSVLERDHMSGVLGEVLWSTAVQHGPTGAARIFRQALGRTGQDDSFTDPAFQGRFIRTVYDLRSRQFGSSTNAVRSAVQNRLEREMELALSLIGSDKSLFA